MRWPVQVGKLNLVDLAGSERQSKTGATGTCSTGLHVGGLHRQLLSTCRLFMKACFQQPLIAQPAYDEDLCNGAPQAKLLAQCW
jgi:hypothetical protein